MFGKKLTYILREKRDIISKFATNPSLMSSQFFDESPFKTILSFHKLIAQLEELSKSNIVYRATYAKGLLEEVAKVPALKIGVEDYKIIEENEELIRYLLSDLFPTALTANEIKAVTIPFQNFTFNYSKRFLNILEQAGVDFDMNIRDFSEDEFFINNCCLILQSYYKQNLDFSRPIFYDIPRADGIVKHYRILYNGDFLEIIPTESALMLTQEDINILVDNYTDITIWKSKFPINSWILKGFAIVNLFDVTTENAISNLKTNLLKAEVAGVTSNSDIKTIFRSLFLISDLQIGFVLYDDAEKSFVRPPLKSTEIQSFILSPGQKIDCNDGLLGCAFQNLLEKQTAFVISDVESFATDAKSSKLAEHLLAKNIRSCIFAPVAKNDKILGIIELMSTKVRDLNSMNLHKLNLIMPYLVDTLERYSIDKQHQIEAIIQREYTTIHPSVNWKFRDESEKYFQTFDQSKDYIFKEIVFKNVYPLYGQIDVKSSSIHRNDTIRQDLRKHLQLLKEIFETQNDSLKLPVLEQLQFQIQSYLLDLEFPLQTNTEAEIQTFIELEINSLLRNPEHTFDKKLVKDYFQSLDSKSGIYYNERKKFDNAMAIINKKLSNVLDKRQLEAQLIFPHYYERFKTDGVEHTMYIGASIAPNLTFDILYLYNLRLWQLQTLCEMELEHHYLKASLPYDLDVTSLILVFSTPITIRFRMDEKRFDIDNSYNVQYEMLKKRIDKATIKGSTERIVEKEKITIVYSNKKEEKEYLNYIKYLQFKQILEPNFEKFEVAETQGVSGLMALRIKIKNDGQQPIEKIDYEQLHNEFS